MSGARLRVSGGFVAQRASPPEFHAVPHAAPQSCHTSIHGVPTPSAHTLQAKQKGKVDLPVPDVSVVADYDTFTAKTFKPTPSYVRRRPIVDPEAEKWKRVEYDADGDDEVRELAAGDAASFAAPIGHMIRTHATAVAPAGFLESSRQAERRRRPG